MVGIGGGLGFDGFPLGLGTEVSDAVSEAFLAAEQQIVEWAPPFSGKLFAEQAIVDWKDQDAGLLTAEHAIVEWLPPPHGRLLDIQQLIEWSTPNKAIITSYPILVEWAVPERGFLFADALLTEWVPGNVLTADRLRLVLGWSQSGQGNGDFYHRSLDDFALAELEQGGERDLDPNGGETGDGFPISGHPRPPLPGDGAGLARYKDDVDDDTDWGPPLV